ASTAWSAASSTRTCCGSSTTWSRANAPPGNRILLERHHDRHLASAAAAAQAESPQRIKLLSANIQAGSSTRRYSDYAMRSWSHVLPAGGKRQALDRIADLAGGHDIVGLQESD